MTTLEARATLARLYRREYRGWQMMVLFAALFGFWAPFIGHRREATMVFGMGLGFMVIGWEFAEKRKQAIRVSQDVALAYWAQTIPHVDDPAGCVSLRLHLRDGTELEVWRSPRKLSGLVSWLATVRPPVRVGRTYEPPKKISETSDCVYSGAGGPPVCGMTIGEVYTLLAQPHARAQNFGRAGAIAILVCIASLCLSQATRPWAWLALAPAAILGRRLTDARTARLSGMSVLGDPNTVYWVQLPERSAIVDYRPDRDESIQAFLHCRHGGKAVIRSSRERIEMFIESLKCMQTKGSMFVGEFYRMSESARACEAGDPGGSPS